MSELSELFGVDSAQVLGFFFEHLRDEVAPKRRATRIETIYVAGVLAHYAQSRCPDGLSEVFDTFVLPGLTLEGIAGMKDPEMLEIAGSQILLFAGFFRNQMKHRHDVEWYDRLGMSFFGRASENSKEKRVASTLGRIAGQFSFWTVSCSNMSKKLREDNNPYLLKLN